MCEMTEPIHGTGKIVSMDSGFCVTAGILHLHELGVYGQALVKKRKYWPKDVPSDQIDRYFDGKGLGFSKTLKQDMDGILFYVHCSKDTKFVTKMMSTHGLLTPIPDHKTYRQNESGQWVSFNYPEFLSRHNHSKHWVDDINNRCHDPIGLEQVWHTKWWPTRQFTFICSIAEANAVNCQAWASNANATPQLEFCRELAMQMLENRIGVDGVVVHSPIWARKRGREDKASSHELCTRPNFTGGWRTELNTWGKITTQYAKIKCSTCNVKIRTYCKCDKKVPMCSDCYGIHLWQLHNTN